VKEMKSLKSFLIYLQQQGIINHFEERENRDAVNYILHGINWRTLSDQAHAALQLMVKINELVDAKAFERPKGLLRDNRETEAQRLLPDGVLAQHKLIVALSSKHPHLFQNPMPDEKLHNPNPSLDI